MCIHISLKCTQGLKNRTHIYAAFFRITDILAWTQQKTYVSFAAFHIKVSNSVCWRCFVQLAYHWAWHAVACLNKEKHLWQNPINVYTIYSAQIWVTSAFIRVPLFFCQIWPYNHVPDPLFTLEIYTFPPAYLPRVTYGSPKLLMYMYLGWVKSQS